MKEVEALKEGELVHQAETQLRKVLAEVPFIHYPDQQTLFSKDGEDADLVLEAQVDGHARIIICEVKRTAEPRQVRDVAIRLRNYAAHHSVGSVYPILVAPFLSAESIAICQKAGIGAMDLAGNAWISFPFDKVFIKSTGNKNPASKRVARALFSAKSARVLRQLLRSPKAPWKVTALSEAAKVSLGQVSNVRKILIDREWAVADEGGFRLTRPREVLEAWQKDYLRSRDRTRYYTLLHGDRLESALRRALRNGAASHAVLASFSAARWWAPYARIATQYFYADIEGHAELIKALALEPVERGENVVIYRPRDEGVFLDSQEAAPGIWCTGLVQTYLDLAASGERGQEAAEHLFKARIAQAWAETV